MAMLIIPRLILSEFGPSPRALIPYMLMVKFTSGGHIDELTLNSWLHTPLVHEVAGTVPFPQLLPVLESV